MEIPNGAFIYPYTELQYEDMQRVITAALLYDEVSYLYYEPEIGEPEPIERKLRQMREKGSEKIVFEYIVV